ncbi:hypothetical protein OG606_36760 [Streptomyces anulatus]|nr:hypothetical protein [Streptomyces sp. b84]
MLDHLGEEGFLGDACQVDHRHRPLDCLRDGTRVAEFCMDELGAGGWPVAEEPERYAVGIQLGGEAGAVGAA